MIVRRNLKWSHILYYNWKSLGYFFSLSVAIYILHVEFGYEKLSIPFNAVATLSTALAIYLGFKNNNAYDRWWEGRKIWGLLVNYSRAWAREVLTMIIPTEAEDTPEALVIQKRLIFRHIAFVHALRVFLRKSRKYNDNGVREILEERNGYEDIMAFVSEEEYHLTMTKKNPPNYLIKLQGDDLKSAYDKGYITDYRYVRLSETLSEFNNHQGMGERIKNTPLPRPYSFFSRIFVFIHGTLIPFAFIEDLGWLNIPLSLIINFVFLALDFVGERTEDPFENRMDDVPLTSISLTIEENLKEMYGGEVEYPTRRQSEHGVVF